VPQALAGFGDRSLFIVDAWLGGAAEDSCDVGGQACYEISWLGSTPDARQLSVQLGAYHVFAGGPVGGGPAVHGLFLVRRVETDKSCGSTTPAPSGGCIPRVEILARLETAAVP
jgi:hypothetical protein